MAYTSTVHFKGLMLFLVRQDPVEVVIPIVDGDDVVAPHQAYIAFPKADADSDWNTSPMPGHDDYSMFPLTGETVYLNAGGSPLQFNPFLPKLKKYCPSVDRLRGSYATRESPETAAHIVLTGGDVGWYVSGGKRIDTVIEMIGDHPLVLTGIYRGRARSLKFKNNAKLVIGNSDPQPTGRTKDFLFYYRMFEVGGFCVDIPAESDADGNPRPKAAVIPDTGLIDIACSNSQYP